MQANVNLETENMKQFKPLTDKYRVYVYPSGFKYQVEEPRLIFVKRSNGGDSHRIVDSRGVAHYIAPGWVAIEWLVADGEPPFFF